VAQEFIAGETLHALANRYDISRTLIRIWVKKFEAGAFDEDAQATDLLEARIRAVRARVLRIIYEGDMSGSMSGVWKRSHGRTSEAPPDERGGKRICSPYSHRAAPRLYTSTTLETDRPNVCFELLRRHRRRS